MFSVRQKRDIADKIEKIIRETGHPELGNDIKFHIHIGGRELWSWADIEDNKSTEVPGVNPWNEMQDGDGQ